MQLTFLQEDLAKALRGGRPAAPAILKHQSSTSQPRPPVIESRKEKTTPAAKSEAHHHTSEKSPGAFKSISEAASILDVPQHVLRFWESKFSQIKPTKLRGGRRYYRPQDIDLLMKIKHLLYKQGYTIKGAKKALRSNDQSQAKMPLAQAVSAMRALPARSRNQFSEQQLGQIKKIQEELLGLREQLAQALAHHPA